MALVDTGNHINEFLINIKDYLDSNISDMDFDGQTVQVIEIGLPNAVPKYPSIFISDEVNVRLDRDGAAKIRIMPVTLQFYVKYQHRILGATGTAKFADKIVALLSGDGDGSSKNYWQTEVGGFQYLIDAVVTDIVPVESRTQGDYRFGYGFIVFEGRKIIN
jgi:hypothetical protein